MGSGFMILFSKDYKKQLQLFHKENPRWGNGPKKRELDIFEFINQNKIKVLLDYGCGKGLIIRKRIMKHCYSITKVINYDPGIPEWESDPPTVDYLMCMDVLEHIEPDYLLNVLDHLVSKFNKKALLFISTKKSTEILPDGKNSHLTIMPSDDWIDLLKTKVFVEAVKFNKNKTGITVIIKK